MDRVIDIPEFVPEDMPLSCTWLLIGKPSSGKTTLLENLVHEVKYRYPVGRFFFGSDTAYKRFCEIAHPLYVSNYFDKDEVTDVVRRQRQVYLENMDAGYEKDYVGNYNVLVIDDASDDPRVYKEKVMRGLYKLGTQHYNQLFLLGTQYSVDLPPDIRRSVSYVALFREPEVSEREKLYKNFGGIVGSLDRFNMLMDQITGDYTALIIKRMSQSNNPEDCISWYRTTPLDMWKFGCSQYHKWAEERYDKNYKEVVMV